MPNYKTHLVGGLASFFLVFSGIATCLPTLQLSLEILILALVLSLVGSIFPDIDIPSKMQKWFYISSIGLIFYSLFLKNKLFFALVCTTIVIVTFLTHRTITHKPLFISVFGLIPTCTGIYCFPEHAQEFISLYAYFTAGSLSHIFLDKAMTFIKKTLWGKRGR